jgi:hypothetical protein
MQLLSGYHLQSSGSQNGYSRTRTRICAVLPLHETPVGALLTGCCHWCIANGTLDNGHSTAGCPRARRDQPTWLVAVWKGAFIFHQLNVFCYFCFLPLDDIGFHDDRRCKHSDIVPETPYALRHGQARTQVEIRKEYCWEMEATWRSLLCKDQEPNICPRTWLITGWMLARVLCPDPIRASTMGPAISLLLGRPLGHLPRSRRTGSRLCRDSPSGQVEFS